MLSADSIVVPLTIDSFNQESVEFFYTAVMPCSGAVCGTIFAPGITAVSTVATNYSVDLSGYPASFAGEGASLVIQEAIGADCPTTPSYIYALAGEDLYNVDPFNDKSRELGPTNSAAFPCLQRNITGTVTAQVGVTTCGTFDCGDGVTTASLGSASFYLHTRTTQAFLNGDTGGGASQPLPKAVAPVVLFSTFVTKLEATTTGFQLVSTFTLGDTSAGIDPLVQPIALDVGPYAVTVPAQSLHTTKKGYYVYQGTIEGDSLQLQIVPGAGGTYSLKADLSAATPGVLGNPTLVALRIGNDFGTALTLPGN
jgi:hypothetical protein